MTDTSALRKTLHHEIDDEIEEQQGSHDVSVQVDLLAVIHEGCTVVEIPHFLKFLIIL